MSLKFFFCRVFFLSILLGVATSGSLICTPPKTNIDTQNDGLEKVIPFKHGYFGYPCPFSGV